MGAIWRTAWTVATALALGAAGSSGASRVVLGPGVYRLLPGSAAGFDLGATLHTVRGRTDAIAGRLELAVSGGGAFTFVRSRVEVAADTLATGNDRRDGKMHEKSLDAARHPLLLFEPDRLSVADPLADAPPGPVDATVSGTLTIRAVSRSVEVPVRIFAAPDRETLSVEGSFDVALAEFGIPDPSVFVLRVDKTARAWVRLELGAPGNGVFP